MKQRLISYALVAFAIVVGCGSVVLLVHFPGIGPSFPSLSTAERLVLDAFLCLLFFVQHSGMIRRGFKRRAETLIPAHLYPAVYAVASGAALVILVLFWQRTDVMFYSLEGPARWLTAGLSLLAWTGFLWGAWSLGARGFDPLGLAPIKANLRGREPRPQGLAIRGPYRYMRHPLYSFVIVAFWATPQLTADVLLSNALFTAWIVVSTRWEERDLVAQFGEAYRRYQATVPMLLPLPRVAARPAPLDPAPVAPRS